MQTTMATDNPETKEKLKAIERAENRALLRQESNAFYYYEPSDGIIPDENKWILEKHLKPKDIPLRFDGQLDFHLSTANIKAIFGGNQAGKSACLAVHCYIIGTGEIPLALRGIFPEDEIIKKAGPVHGRIVGVSSNQVANTVIPAFQEWCPKNYLKKGDWDNSFSVDKQLLTLYEPGTFKVKLTIEFKSNEQKVKSFQGPALDFIGYDEEPLSAIREENLLRFVTSGKLREYYAFTPTSGISWATDLFLDPEDDDGNTIKKFELCTVTNKKANLEVVDKILSQIPEYNVKKMRLLGEVISLSGLVYGKLFDAIHVIEPFDIDKENYIVYRGLDPHLVKPSVCVEVATDRWLHRYVCGAYQKGVDTEEFKADLAARAEERNYRLGWSRCDISSNSTITILGNRNIYLELGRGKNYIPALFTSEKYKGSIHAGVDEIKKHLKINENTKKPTLFIFDTPELRPLIKSFKTLERDTHANEDKKGPKDEIQEGKHDHHAALRYAFQAQMNWIPPVVDIPEYVEERFI